MSSADVQLALSASDALVGETTLRVSVKDLAGKPITEPGLLSIRGDMNHAGMVPVFAQAEESEDGVFSLPFEWTMAGDWTVEASLRLPSGDTAQANFNFEIRANEEMTGKERGGMDHQPGETSAVYMRISNRGATDRVIVSAESAAAKQIDFHQTVVENEIARMEALDALVIPAGETLELRPGGAHIMLSALTEDLNPEDSFSLRFECGAGEIYELDISIANMPLSELDDAVQVGDLVFSNRWARPASAGGMAHSDMPMNAEAETASG